MPGNQNLPFGNSLNSQESLKKTLNNQEKQQKRPTCLPYFWALSDPVLVLSGAWRTLQHIQINESSGCEIYRFPDHVCWDICIACGSWQKRFDGYASCEWWPTWGGELRTHLLEQSRISSRKCWTNPSVRGIQWDQSRDLNAIKPHSKQSKM